MRLALVVVAGALAAACTVQETRTVVPVAPVADACSAYGYAPGSEGDDLVLQGFGRMAIAPAVRREQHDAVAGAPPAVVEPPGALRIKAHQGFDPRIAAVEVGPLVGEAQMHLDDARVDRLEVDDA